MRFSVNRNIPTLAINQSISVRQCSGTVYNRQKISIISVKMSEINMKIDSYGNYYDFLLKKWPRM